MINLRPVRPDDILFFQVWWRDEDLIKMTSGNLDTLTDQQIQKYFDDIASQSNGIHRMIETDTGITIGHVSLLKRKDGWYETQIVIGDKPSQNKGYGTESIRRIIALARSQSVANVYLEVRPENARAIKSYQNAGFHIVNTLMTSNTLQPSLIRMEL